MAEKSTAPWSRCIRLAVQTVTAPAPDADLLAAFVRHRDAAAFEQIVRRHGPLVLSACRHILSDPADADDAYQATFVVLYRKAHTIRRGGTLGGWLFGIARRAAIEVKRAATRRRFHEERRAQSESVPGPDLSWREACAILHEELDALPAKYRLPLIACYVEGRTQDETARDLGWPAEVVRGRIDRGRAMLGRRLRMRGVTLSAGLLAAALVAPAAPVIGLQSVIGPSPSVVAAAAALTAQGRAWTVVGAFSLVMMVVGGAFVLRTAMGPDKNPAAPPKEPVAERPAPRPDTLGDPLPEGAIARLGTVRFNHGDGLKSVFYAPDGKTILTVGNGFVRIWDAAKGTELRQFPINKASWDDQTVVRPDGKSVVLLQQDGVTDSLREYDIETGMELRHTPVRIQRYSMSVDRRNALSPDGRLAAINHPKTLQVFDMDSKKFLVQIPKGGPEIRDVAFAGPDLLVTADTARTIDVWEARTGKLSRSFDHGDPVQVLIVSADGKLLATLEHHNHAIDRYLDKDRVHVWDLGTGKRLQSLEARPKSWFMGAAFAMDGRSLLTVDSRRDGGSTTLWELASGKPSWERNDNLGQILAPSPDQKRIAIGSQGGRFTILDFETGKLANEDSLAVRAPGIHLSSTGDQVIAVSYRSISTWDGTTGRRLDSFDVPYFGSVGPWRIVSPNGRYAMTVSLVGDRSFVQVWDVSARRELHKILGGGEYFGGTLAFSPDSARFAIRQPGDPAKIAIYDVRTGKETVTFSDPRTKWPGTMRFSTDGQSLIVAGHRVVTYSAANGKELFSYRVEPVPDPSPVRVAPIGGPGAEADRLAWRVFAASPDGLLGACVLSGGFGGPPLAHRLLLCDGRTGKVIRRWSDSGKAGRMYEQIVFSDDGRLLATSDGYDIHLWEVATGKEARTFRGHRNEIEGLAFSANGRRLASSSWDGTVVIWELSAPTKEAPDPVASWTSLLEAESAKAYAAVWRLADAADDVTVPFLRQRLRPVTLVDVEKVRKSIADLDSDQFRVRDRSFRELSDMGHHAGPALCAALEKKPSPEARNRIEQLVAKIVGPPSTGELLRTSRALAVLESKGTPAAKELLRELADGAPDAWLTQEAKAALRRGENR